MGINKELFQKHFRFQGPSEMVKVVYNISNKKESIDLINVIKSGLSDLKEEILKNRERWKENWKAIYNSKYCWKDSWL